MSTARLSFKVLPSGHDCSECAICCTGEYSPANPALAHEGMGAQHIFHEQCIGRWLTKDKSTCPLCNMSVTHVNGQTIDEYRAAYLATADTLDLQKTALFDASRAGNLQQIQQLISGTAFSEEDRGFAIVQAAEGRHVEVMGFLLQRGEILDHHRIEAIKALLGHHPAMVKRLLQLGPLSDPTRGRILVEAAKAGDAESANELIAVGPIASEYRGEAMVNAAKSGTFQIIETLLQQEGALDAIYDEVVLEIVKFSPLPSLDGEIQEGPIAEGALAEIIDARGARVICSLLLQGTISAPALQSAITTAAKTGYGKILEILIQKGELSSYEQGSLLLTAAECGHLAVIEVLLKHQPISEAWRSWAVVRAAKANNRSIVMELLKDGAVINSIERGEAIHMATINQNLPLLKELLKNKEPIEMRWLRYALPHAVREGQIEILKALLDQQLLSKEHQIDLLTCAAEQGHLNILQELLNRFGPSQPERLRALFAAANHNRWGNVDVLQGGIILSDVEHFELKRCAFKQGNVEKAKELTATKPILSEDLKELIFEIAKSGPLISIQFLLEKTPLAENDRDHAFLIALDHQQVDIARALIEDKEISEDDLKWLQSVILERRKSK